MQRTIPLFLSVFAAVMSSGCFFTALLDDVTTPNVNINPEAWVPRVDGDDFTPINTSAQVATRELKVGDPVMVKMAFHLRQQAPIEDVVDEEGNITLPMIGEFHVLGMTTGDAERAIRKVYIENKIYNDLTVNVINKAAQEAAAEAYSITGAVHKRGRFPLKEGMTLREAVVAAGDVTDFAGDKIRITRNGMTKDFSYRKIKRGTAIDPPILNGDIIEVTD